MKTMLNRMFSKFQTCRNRIWRRADAVGAIQGNPALKEAYGMGKKFKGMYMQKCGLRDGSLVPVTALLAHGLTDSYFKISSSK